MNIGDKFPDLLGLDGDGKEIRLSDFPGKKFIIYFYPKDNTSGCTMEAASLRDNYDTFLSMGYQIIGVSKDSQASHRKFAELQKLPFPLISERRGKPSGAPPQCLSASYASFPLSAFRAVCVFG